jgi:hypothetical protein
MSERPTSENPPVDSQGADTDDLGFRDDEENRAYEDAQPDSQPEVSSDPEPDGEPADAG